MNLEDTMNALTEAGFQVNAIYPYIIVSLNNRPVSKIEVAVALFKRFDIFPKAINRMLSHSGDTVLIKL